MIKIKRLSNGEHFVSGTRINMSKVKWYRKTTPIRAIQMDELFSVETMEGTMKGKAGDWLMIGVNGEMYPCDADVFEKTYEPVKGVK